jgi:hypothetical protein
LVIEGNAEGYQMRQLATSSSKARNTMKLNQTLETLKYSHVNPASVLLM